MKGKLLKSVLLSILTMFAAGVWAGEVTATLEHTAGAQWGSNKGASTVDAEKEHYNNDAASAWAGCAYAHFSFTLPEGESVTKATLTYNVNQGGKYGRNDIIYYMAKDFVLDYTTFAGQTATDLRNASSRAGKAVEAAPTGGTGDRLNLKQDVTNAVKAIVAAGQSYIIFQWTGNAGGADLYGKASDKAPTLVIETASAASQTKYTVNFTDGTNTLKDAKVYDGMIGDKVAASADDLGKFVVGDKKYAYQSGNDSIVLVKEEASNVLTLVFAELPKYEYAVVSSLGDTLKTASDFKDEDITYYYPGFALKDTTFYTAPKNSSNPYYGGSFKLDQDKKSVTVTYTKSESIKNVVYFSEAENIEGATPKTTNNATIRCSNGTGAIFADTTQFVTLTPGIYQIFGQVWGTTGVTASVTDEAKKVLWSLASTGSLVNSTSDEFTLNEATDLFVSTAGGNDNHMLDLIYIVKTGDVAAVEEPIVADTVVFNFADPAFREKIGENLQDANGNIFNETFTVGETTLQVTAGSAPSRIYKDANRGQNLVTYMQYTTLTFRAPEGKAISQIEFTAAGNSNINKFTASCDSIKGMTWMGNADGVRFEQDGTSYLANAIVTLVDKNDSTKTLPEIEYTECANIAAFNALAAGTYAKVTLTDAEVIGKSADGYSTVWLQDATGGCWIQYTSLNDSLKESTKVNGTVYVVKRAVVGNPHMKEAEGTLKSELNATGINEYTIVKGDSIKQINVAANLNKVVKIVADSLKMTSATEGTLYVGQESIAMNNGGETANQQLHKIADWKKDSMQVNVEVTAILVAKSATANQLLPIAIEQLKEPVTFNFAANPQNWPTSADITDYETGKVTELTVDGVKLVAIQNNEFVGNILYKAADADTTIFRVGKQNAFKLIAPEGKALVSVNVTMAAATFDFETSTGAVADNVWTGNATEVTFTTTLNRQILKIEVMLADENEETVKPATAVEVADIAAFNALEAGKLAKLTLNDARVNAVNGGKYYVEDATGAMVIKGVELSAGKALNGYIVGVKSNEEQRDFVADVVAAIEYQLTADDASTLNVTDTTLVGTVMTFAEAGVQANYGRLITFENVSVSGSGNNKTLTDAAGNTFKARDWMGVLPADYTWPEKVSSITGVVVFNSTAWFLMPISDEAIVAAQTTGIRNINAADRNVVIYNLQGVRQDRAKKGLNIIDGKKVVIK